MTLDLQHAEALLPDFVADVCIVGAGAAGIVLASEIARRGLRVLLLESGGDVVEPNPQKLNICEFTGQPRREFSPGRFRALGGTTTVWGGQIGEPNAEDFAERCWISGSGWAISKSELQPYYARAIQAEGLGGAIPEDTDVWRALEMPAPDIGDVLGTYFTRWCPEPNFARLYRGVLKSQKICIVLHATAAEMQLADCNTRIAGIRCRTIAGKERTFRAPYYVLCLGTIETVRFLLQPGSNGQVPAWNRSGLLGQHFQSHIDFNAAVVPPAGAARLHSWFANVYLGGHKYHPKFRLSHSVQQAEKVLNIVGSITCINPEEQDLRRAKSLARDIVRGRVSAASWANLPRLVRHASIMVRLGYGYRVQHRAYWPKESAFWFRVHCEQEPLSASRITLTADRDPTGLLRARVDWRISPLEWKTVRVFTERVKRTLASLHLADIEMVSELRDDAGFRDVVFDNSHHDMGGTRMAESASDGVVDPNLRLHGMENAYVCSASVFPTSGFSNPTHTLIALAIRLADHLVSRRKMERESDRSSRPKSTAAEEVEGPAASVDPIKDASDG